MLILTSQGSGTMALFRGPSSLCFSGQARRSMSCGWWWWWCWCMSCHVMSCHVMSWHGMSYHAMPCHVDDDDDDDDDDDNVSGLKYSSRIGGRLRESWWIMSVSWLQVCIVDVHEVHGLLMFKRIMKSFRIMWKLYSYLRFPQGTPTGRFAGSKSRLQRF